jgi:predicted lysophospholipase L1 biosynthesis ABC-type transport system permease subunit
MPLNEQEAIAKLIREIDSVAPDQTKVPRRIFALFALVIAAGMLLMVFSLKFGRRDRPIETRTR